MSRLHQGEAKLSPSERLRESSSRLTRDFDSLLLLSTSIRALGCDLAGSLLLGDIVWSYGKAERVLKLSAGRLKVFRHDVREGKLATVQSERLHAIFMNGGVCAYELKSRLMWESLHVSLQQEVTALVQFDKLIVRQLDDLVRHAKALSPQLRDALVDALSDRAMSLVGDVARAFDLVHKTIGLTYSGDAESLVELVSAWHQFRIDRLGARVTNQRVLLNPEVWLGQIFIRKAFGNLLDSRPPRSSRERRQLRPSANSAFSRWLKNPSTVYVSPKRRLQ